MTSLLFKNRLLTLTKAIFKLRCDIQFTLINYWDVFSSRLLFNSKRVNLQNWEVKEVTPGSSCVSFLLSDEHWQPNSTPLGSSPQRKERLEQNREPRRASIPLPHNYKRGHLQFLKTNWNVEVALQKWTNKQKEKGRRLFQECASTLTDHVGRSRERSSDVLLLWDRRLLTASRLKLRGHLGSLISTGQLPSPSPTSAFGTKVCNEEV